MLRLNAVMAHRYSMPVVNNNKFGRICLALLTQHLACLPSCKSRGYPLYAWNSMKLSLHSRRQCFLLGCKVFSRAILNTHPEVDPRFGNHSRCSFVPGHSSCFSKAMGLELATLGQFSAYAVHLPASPTIDVVTSPTYPDNELLPHITIINQSCFCPS